MALPDTIGHEGSTSRTTGIAAQAIVAGANFLGSAIDNATNLDLFADIEVAFVCGVAPTANTVLEVYLLYSIGGTNYEDGDATPVDPKANPVGTAAAYNDTNTHYQTIKGVPLRPSLFKILVKSELNRDATVTVLCYTNKRQVND